MFLNLKNKTLNYYLLPLLIISFVFLFGFNFSITQTLAAGNEGDECNLLNPCNSGLKCEVGFCAAIIKGTTCSSNSDCQTGKTGLVCNSGQCGEFTGDPITPPTVTPSQTGTGPDLGPNPTLSPNSSWCNNDPNLIYSNGVCLPKDQMTGQGIAGSSSFTDFLIRVIKILLGLAGVVSVLFLILGGFWYMTSAGNAEQAEKGKNTITNFFLGLVIIIMAYALVTILNNFLTTGK